MPFPIPESLVCQLQFFLSEVYQGLNRVVNVKLQSQRREFYIIKAQHTLANVHIFTDIKDISCNLPHCIQIGVSRESVRHSNGKHKTIEAEDINYLVAVLAK